MGGANRNLACPHVAGNAWKSIARGQQTCNLQSAGYDGCCNRQCCNGSGPNPNTNAPTQIPTPSPTTAPTDSPTPGPIACAKDTVMCGKYQCAALKSDATVEVWGPWWGGADTSRVDVTNVANMMCGRTACVALKKDDTAVAWGDAQNGGDASGADLTNVKDIMCGSSACIALKKDGTGETWGMSAW